MTTEQTESNLRQRVQRAIISNAIFDWRGGVIIALSILLGFFGPDLFPGLQSWYFLLGGAAAWGALTFSIIKDPEMAAQVAAGLLRPTRGRHRLFGADLADLGEREQVAQRIRMGMVDRITPIPTATMMVCRTAPSVRMGCPARIRMAMASRIIAITITMAMA